MIFRLEIITYLFLILVQVNNRSLFTLKLNSREYFVNSNNLVINYYNTTIIITRITIIQIMY